MLSVSARSAVLSTRLRPRTPYESVGALVAGVATVSADQLPKEEGDDQDLP